MKFKERPKAATKIEVADRVIPYVVISQLALSKMWQYVDQCSDEIGWLGTATRNGHYYYIDDMFLFDQEVHATTTEITPEGLFSFAEELLQTEDGMETWNKMRVWGHSHVNMAINPSGQDDSQMKVFEQSGSEWFIRIIANKKGELKVDVYDYTAGLMFYDACWNVEITEEEEEIVDAIKKLEEEIERIRLRGITDVASEITEEMKAKVRKKTFSKTTSSYNYGGYGQWIDGRYYTNYEVEQMEKDQKKKKETTEKQKELNTGGTEDTTTNKMSRLPGALSDRNGNPYGDFLWTDDDIFTYLSLDDMIRIGFCSSVDEVIFELEELGYVRFFSTSDINRIYQAAVDIAEANPK